MSHLHLLWRGPQSPSLLQKLSLLLLENYPDRADDLYLLARSLEEFTRQLLSAHSGVVDIDNQLYWTKPLRELKLNLPLRYSNEGIFPDSFLEAEGLNRLSDDVVESLCVIVVEEIEESLMTEVRNKVVETYTQKKLSIFVDEEIEIADEFEKNQLGIFLYLLYLKRRFAGDDKVCVITSELGPLFKKCKTVEQDLVLLNRSDFIAKNPQSADSYDILREAYRNAKIHTFRIALLLHLIEQIGPYIVGKEVVEKAASITNTSIRSTRFKVEPTKSFRILFDRCRGAKSRYSVSFVSIYAKRKDQQTQTGHGTILIIDNVERVIERFDPNGAVVTPELQAVTEATDELLASFAKQEGYLYAEPGLFCPKSGIQQIEHLFNDKPGYCVSWSILYAEERLQSSKSRQYVATHLLDEIVNKYHLQDSDKKATAEKVETWMKDRIVKIFSEMDEVYKELSDYLEIPVSYVNGRLVYHS